jgi:hypothetical protein
MIVLWTTAVACIVTSSGSRSRITGFSALAPIGNISQYAADYFELPSRDRAPRSWKCLVKDRFVPVEAAMADRALQDATYATRFGQTRN